MSPGDTAAACCSTRWRASSKLTTPAEGTTEEELKELEEGREKDMQESYAARFLSALVTPGVPPGVPPMCAQRSGQKSEGVQQGLPRITFTDHLHRLNRFLGIVVADD
jgi:hypothetical protein